MHTSRHILILALLLTLCAAPATAGSDLITFADPIFAEMFYAAFGYMGPVIASTLASIDTLIIEGPSLYLDNTAHSPGTLADYPRIGSWQDIALFPNLTTLHIQGHPIDDLSPLEGLSRLTHLHLSDCPLGTNDFAPLAHLTSLKSLGLQSCGLSCLAPLAKSLSTLPSLETLILNHNAITDIAPLAAIPSLRSLHIGGNPIEDYAPLAGMPPLTALEIIGVGLQDLSPIANLISLETLILDNNQISDISPLEGLTALRHLRLQENSITDISPPRKPPGPQNYLPAQERHFQYFSACKPSQYVRPHP